MGRAFSYELTTGEETVTHWYPADEDSIESFRIAAQNAANALGVPVTLYVMPTEGDEWCFDFEANPERATDGHP